jgi:hypothetical protein
MEFRLDTSVSREMQQLPQATFDWQRHRTRLGVLDLCLVLTTKAQVYNQNSVPCMCTLQSLFQATCTRRRFILPAAGIVLLVLLCDIACGAVNLQQQSILVGRFTRYSCGRTSATAGGLHPRP